MFRSLSFVALFALFSNPLYAETRPNIVLIMADDMGYECVGANGSEHYKTPNLDKLASEGIRFEHAYSQPICTPSRVQIMTGRYNGRNYVRFGLLHPNEITFGNILKEAGYKTCIAGKWQLEGGFEGPNKFGFDEYCLWQLTRRPTRYPNPGLEINCKQVDYTNGEYGPDVVSDYLIDFIKRNKDEPFFAYYPMILPHFPFQPTPDSVDWDPTETKEWRGKQWTPRHFKDMVEYADKMVGKVDKALAELGVRDNTILIFTCDNGTHPSIVSPFQGKDYKGGKASTPNAGTHVPMIANWPAKMKSASVSQDLIDFSDILPTLAEASNAKLPTDRKLDGRSFLPQLRGEKGNPRDWTFCWYERNGNREGNVKRFARNQTYKLYHDGRFYNIPKDELEKNSLLPSEIDTTQKTIQTKLKAVIDRLYEEEKEFPYEEARKTMKKKSNNKKKKKPKNKKQKVIGNPDFIHLQNDNGVWWLADHTGKRFITTGMNHVGEGGVLFNEVNEGWLTGKFGADIKGSWGGLNPRAKKMGSYADMVVKDFKDYAFNTIPFHAYSTPLDLYEDRKIYYVAKLKVQNISLMQMNRARGDRFPDVFSTGFRNKLDGLTKKICSPLRDAKYCLGYACFDMPDLKPVRRWHRRMFPDGGLVYPWVQDMRSLPASAAGKQEWLRILKQNHASAAEAARVYAINDIASWEDLAKVTSWPIKPNDVPRVRKDAEDMLTSLAEKWYSLHHELIRKYDPNHLLLGDKHDIGYDKSVDMIPDGVLSAIAKYNDVLMIQYYSFYTDLHNTTLRKLHNKTGLPIINGDHSYSFKTSKHTKIKGLEVESFDAVANEYRRYMKGTLEDHPYMLGWWHCGYIEQWAPAGSKQLGQQNGFFSPFGEPNTKLLSLVKDANENASKWHSNASTKDQSRAQKQAPNTPAEMFAAMNLTAEQQTKLDAMEKEHKAAQAKFRDLNAEALRDAQNSFYTERKKKLKKILTEEQWTIWSSFWNRNKTATKPNPPNRKNSD